ncbi:MAG: glycine betaine/L-proline ABC transporter substrate-binding protein ProX [Moorea sp. SIO3I7]|uniref:glycine betaine/L-proline ABC transporter substrate-binding protein ProX n=1 Tax=Moorena sp. SIO3I8 TaxID=2607833 RepID=UPI0013C0392D|nr:glycine betaine/L-proline ABC transporter substrate-binding protein ProX [Moorena sp. SIO3I8]NEN96523.1 glycine betaine/L-proline ABC transporter substrate-binding protein ProX [Moorena sp. SIO3I7]NEO08864.1 glycine betaine/L-proline ABC transporter substrate-binding protein ProX [Moorena sp. SIO3I8]
MTIRKINKFICAILAAALCFSLIACGAQTPNGSQSTAGKGVKVRSASSVSTYALFVSEIINIGLEKVGYKPAAIKQLSIPLAHISVSNGDVDFYSVHWQNIHKKFFLQNGGDQKLEKVGVIIADGLQSYQIDKKTAEQYKITNLGQLKDPKIAKLFDSDGDGKANLTGCNPGWGCELVIEHQLDAYKLRDIVEHDQGNYDVLLAATLGRYKQGQPILFYSYSPHWSVTVLKPGEDTIRLEVPFLSLPKEQENITEKDTTVDGKNVGFAVDQVRVMANKKFLAANPAAKRLFELITVPIEDVNAQQKLVQDGESSPKDIRRHAEEWVNKNQELFDSWVESAKKAATN